MGSEFMGVGRGYSGFIVLLVALTAITITALIQNVPYEAVFELFKYVALPAYLGLITIKGGEKVGVSWANKKKEG